MAMEGSQENEIYVDRTGLAVVDQGDRIVAAPGSEATLSVRERGEVHYYFPVHVVVVGDVSEAVKCEIEARIWDGLHSALV
jgi:hypothetical protein